MWRASLASLLGLICGCGPAVYVPRVDAGAPSATIRVSHDRDGPFMGARGGDPWMYDVSLAVFPVEHECGGDELPGFYASSAGSLSLSREPITFDVTAERPIFLRAAEFILNQRAQGSCEVLFGFEPEPGRTYDVKLRTNFTRSCTVFLSDPEGRDIELLTPDACFSDYPEPYPWAYIRVLSGPRS